MTNNISAFLFPCRLTRPGPADDYTKIVWADTYMVGCGYTGFFCSDGAYCKFFVCLYGPGGNIVGEKVYQIGPACSACPAGTTCEDGLCA